MKKLLAMMIALMAAVSVASAQDEKPAQVVDTIIDTIDEARDYISQMDTIFFDLADGRYDASHNEALQKLAKIMIDNPSFVLFLKCYGDAAGNDDFNRQLGSRRATYIRGFLAMCGVSPSAVQSASLGKLPNLKDLPNDEYIRQKAFAVFEIHQR